MPPSDQCTEEMEASATGAAPRRSMAATTAAVQSPSPGRCTTSTVKPPSPARVIHSSTGEEWSSCSTSTREPAGTASPLAAVATPYATDEMSATSPGSAWISRAAALRARSYCWAANAWSISHGRPLRATPRRPASWTASGSGLQAAALR